MAESFARETVDCGGGSDSDSSDSSVVSESGPKRQRATRGLQDEETSSQPTETTTTSEIYTVDTSWDKHTLPVVDSDSDVDEEVGNIFERKGRSRNKRKGTEATSAPVKQSLIELSDSDPEEIIVETIVERALSPSPPPADCQRKRRRNKRMKEAFRNAEKLKTMLHVPDVCIVSPRKSIEPDTTFEKELIVKIRSRSGIQRFTMKHRDSFHGIIRAMASHEFVKENQIAFILNDISIKPYDTPSTVDLTVADIIECHILRADDVDRCDAVKAYLDPSEPDVLSLRVQSKDTRLRSNMLIRKTEPMERLMNEYANERHTSVDKLAFFFDGDKISPTDTPDDLDLEDSFCVDVTGI